MKRTVSLSQGLNPEDPLNDIVFFGQKFKPDVLKNLIEAEYDASTSQIAQISLKMLDPQFMLMRKGIYVPRIPVSFEGYMLEVSNIETGQEAGQESLSVKCRPRTVRKLKDATGKNVKKGVSPSQYVELQCKALKIKCVAQPSPKRKQVARDVKGSGEGNKDKDKTAARENQPSDWTTFARLAGEVGFIMFEYANTIYFGKPTWLLEYSKKKKNVLYVHWGSDKSGFWRPNTVPICTKSLESKVATVGVNLPVAAYKDVGLGKALKMSGVPEFDEFYLIDSINYPLAGAQMITVTASTPIDPEKVETSLGGSGAGGSSSGGSGSSSSTGEDGEDTVGNSGASGKGTASDFVGLCLAQSGDTYVYGAEASLDDSNPTTFDCSELIQWAAARTGVYIPDGSTSQIGYCQSKGLGLSVEAAKGTLGALLYYSGGPHIAVSLGNGETIEAVGTGYGVRKMSASRSFNWTAGGRIPGMRY